MNITIPARKLEDVNVTFVSLVKRGANRVPFRIMKHQQQEEGMIDLANIFTTRKAEAPSVSAVVVSKDKVTEEIVAKMEGFGMVQQDASEEDTSVIFKAADYSDESAVVQMNNDAAVVLSTVKKAFYDYPSSSDFDENLSKSSFFPSVDMAIEILEETIKNIMYGNDIDQAGKSAAIGTAVDSFKGYITGLAAALPASAYELTQFLYVASEEEVAKEESATDTVEKSGEETVESTSDIEASDADTDTVTKEEGTDLPNGDGVSDTEETVAKDDSTDTVEKAEDTTLEAITSLTETVAKMAESMTALSDKVETVSKSTEGLGERVEKAEATAASAKEDLEGTVLGATSEESIVAKQETTTDVFAGSALDKLL